MEQQYPFSKEESSELRRLAKSVIKGYRVADLSKREVIFKQIIDYFLLSIGFEKGDVYHLPYSGGTLEQPNKTLKCWMIVRSEFLDYIADQNKKQMQRMASKSRRR